MKRTTILCATYTPVIITAVLTLLCAPLLGESFSESFGHIKHLQQRIDQPRHEYYAIQTEQLLALAQHVPKESQTELSAFITNALYDRLGWCLNYAQRAVKGDELVHAKYNIFYALYKDSKKFDSGWITSGYLTADDQKRLKALQKHARACSKTARKADSGGIGSMVPSFMKKKAPSLNEQIRTAKKDVYVKMFSDRYDTISSLITSMHRSSSKNKPNVTRLVSELSALPCLSVDTHYVISEIMKLPDNWHKELLHAWEQLYTTPRDRVKVALHGMISSKRA